MTFDFRRQTMSVANLLQVCNTVLPRLEGEDHSLLMEAMRVFETVGTAVEFNEWRVEEQAKPHVLAKAEMREAVDRLMRCIPEAISWQDKFDLVIQGALQARKVPQSGMHQDSKGCWKITPREDGNGWDLLFWDGYSRLPVEQHFGDYAKARDRVDELAKTSQETTGERLGSKGEFAWVVVPREGSGPDLQIGRASGIVAQRQGDQVVVYYEGNLYGYANLKSYTDRVKNAAGRLFKRYPTIAKSVYSLSQFQCDFRIVGYCSDAYVVNLTDKATVRVYVAQPGESIAHANGDSYTMDESGVWSRQGVKASRDEVSQSVVYVHESYFSQA